MLIYLVGFMGAGKTSVGVRLAELLGWRFVDLDEEIENCEGESIRAIFQARGEARFRALERQQLLRVSTMTDTVVALGGGAFCSDDNRRTVDATGISVWLDAPIEIIHARCTGDATRPLFSTLEEMRTLLERRRPFYEKSRIRVDVGNSSVDQVSREIQHLLAANYANSFV